MAEEQQGQEKTEEATPRKLEKAKEEGQVARSRELNSVAIVTFGAVAAYLFIPDLAATLLAITESLFYQAGQVHQASQLNIPLTHYLTSTTWSALYSLLPLLVALFLAGVISSIGVGGLVIAPKALAPKLERLSMIKGFGRMFSIKALVELGKSLAKFVLITSVAIAVLYYVFSHILVLGALPVEVAVREAVSYVALAFLLIGASLIVVALIDVPFQMAQHKKQLKMTKQEVKDELKDSEGKPELKAKLRAMQAEAAQRKSLEEVPQADVVITNPEHFSVAIRYQAGEMAAPVVLATGVDFLAMRIREIATAHDIPQVAAPPLARAIYYTTEAGQEVPEGLYVAVAQVLAYVYQLEQYQRGQMGQAPTLADMQIPEEFRRD